VNRRLVGEVFRMAIETLRANTMRSALTILGVVIGITAIVGMTSLIRGFDQSLRDSVRELGPSTIFLAKISIVSIAGGTEFSELLRRPNLTVDDAKAIEKLAPSIKTVDIMLGTGVSQTTERLYYRGDRTRQLAIIGTTEQFAEANFATLGLGRFFTEPEVRTRRRVAVIGDTAYQALFAQAGIDPIGKRARIGAVEFTVIGVLAKRPSAGGFGNDQDDLVVIPQTTHQVMFASNATRERGIPGQNSATIMVVPRDTATREQALSEVEQIMRIRHGLKLDEPNDFDLATQDAILRVWDQISQATFLALVVISSVALMVGGIGVMAIMMISVTERTREIGVRKALGARRQEILFQFLSEAAVLTSIGGVLGILGGSAIGLSVNLATGFPISLPWWSFALGLGFSASVGIFFGMMPAVRASRLDPIEALRHE
jgi:putative ABC transport system permease protein